MMERFLYVLPKSKLGFRTHNKSPVSEAITYLYNEKIRSFLNISSTIKDTSNSIVLSLSPDAYQNWHTFQRRIEVELRPNGKLSGCLGWGGKVCGYALRLAGLLHIAEYSSNEIQISDAMRNRKLGKAERLNPALEVLIDRNILSEPIEHHGYRKPITLFQVHSKIISMNQSR